MGVPGCVNGIEWGSQHPSRTLPRIPEGEERKKGEKTREGKKGGEGYSHTPLPCYAGSADILFYFGDVGLGTEIVKC